MTRAVWHLVTVANFLLAGLILTLDWLAGTPSHWSTIAVAVIGCIYVSAYFANEAAKAALIAKKSR